MSGFLYFLLGFAVSITVSVAGILLVRHDPKE